MLYSSLNRPLYGRLLPRAIVIPTMTLSLSKKEQEESAANDDTKKQIPCAQTHFGMTTSN
jgi:hypothetical protein